MTYLALVITIGLPHHGRAQWPSTPTSAEIADIGRGQVVVLQQHVDGAPWPRLRLYRFIDATPEQSLAMLADYEHQRSYTRDLKEARIERQLDSARTEVFYRYASNVPFVKDVTFTSLQRLRRAPDGTYSVEWTLKSGHRVKHTEGVARFSSWANPVTGRPGTLLTYDNYVVPDFPFSSSGLARRKALESMRDAVDAIAREVERERSQDRTLLDRQVAALRAALAY